MHCVTAALVESACTTNHHAVQVVSVYSDWRAYAFLAYFIASIWLGIRIGTGKEKRVRAAAEQLRRSALFKQLSAAQSIQLSGQDDRPAPPGMPKT